MYKAGKVYKLISDNSDQIYIGSTCNPLYKRKAQHKSRYQKYLEGKDMIYSTAFEIVKAGGIDIVLVESYPCDSKEELHARERYWIEKLRDQCVNKNIPTRSIKEWYTENKSQIKEKKKENYEQNKPQILEKAKKYRQKNEENIREFLIHYREENKEKLKQQSAQKFACGCGGHYTYANKKKHEKSNKHVKYLNTLKEA